MSDLFDDNNEDENETSVEVDEFGYSIEEKSNDPFVLDYVNKKNSREYSPDFSFIKIYGDASFEGVVHQVEKFYIAKKTGLEALSDIVYPSKWFRDNNDNVSIEVVAKCGKDYIKKIIPLKNLRADFFMEMDSIGFIPEKNNAKDRESLRVYFMNLVNRLMKNVAKSNYVHQLGWQDDGSFVVGNTRYSKEGENKIQVQGKYKSIFSKFNRKGDIAKFKRGIDMFLSIDKLKYHHCYFLIGIATPLLKMAELNGSFCNLRSDRSGTFKSITQKIITGFYTNDVDDHILDFTYTYVFDTLRTYQNFPVIIEEISEKITNEPHTVAKIVYENSGGKSKGRGTSDGETKDGLKSNSNVMTSSNPSVYEAMEKSNEAKLLRILEIDLAVLESNKPNHFDDIADKAITAFELVKNNPGFGSELFSQIVMNKEEVTDMIKDKVKEVFGKFSSRNNRYVVFMIATALVMADILEQMGFAIDVKKVNECFDKIIQMTESKVQEYKLHSDDIIDVIFSSLKVQHIIKTPSNKIENDPNAQEHMYPDAWCLDGRELRIPVEVFENKLFNGKQKGVIKMIASDALNTVFASQNVCCRKEQLTMFKVKNRYYVIDIPLHKQASNFVVVRSEKQEKEDQDDVNRLFG